MSAWLAPAAEEQPEGSLASWGAFNGFEVTSNALAKRNAPLIAAFLGRDLWQVQSQVLIG